MAGGWSRCSRSVELQGAIGWWMVASGLTVRTDVSHVRLAVHLITALVLLAGMVWTALDLRALAESRLAAPASLKPLAVVALALLFSQIMFGAFTAGLDAGYAFSSWPLMGNALFPAGVAFIEPIWRNAVDNPVVVQFIHRWFAFVAATALILLALRAIRQGGVIAGAHAHLAGGAADRARYRRPCSAACRSSSRSRIRPMPR